MDCPKCAAPNHRVLQTRQESTESTIRHRICRGCGHEFFTVEIDLPPDSVIQGTGNIRRKEGFRRITFS